MSKQVSVLNDLLDGNSRFVQDNSENLGEYVEGQWPKAAVLTCSDSRIVPEIIFDQWIGEIFVIRVAGNIASDDTVIQSLEYAAEHLKVPLILILGHSHCGAVALTRECLGKGESPEGLVKEIASGLEMDDDPVVANVKRQVKMLPVRSEAISNAMMEERLAVMGVYYNLETGIVNLIQG